MRPSLPQVLAAITAIAPAAHGATRVDMIEHLFGASNTNAVGGHGRLTVGVGAEGDLSVLSWPSPSYYDQLGYLSGNALDVREQPHLGAHDGMGSYLGLLVDSGGGPKLVWLRDAAWTRSQGYSRDDAPVPLTRFERADLGLTVTLTDVVSPDRDVLTRTVRVERSPASPVLSASLVGYENLSPTLSKIAQLPLADWGLDSRNDFLALWDATRSEVVHLHPADRAVVEDLLGIVDDPTEVDYGAVEALMKSAAPAEAAIASLVADLDGQYPPGVVALVTTEPTPTGHQVGSDATPICQQIDLLVDNIQALPSLFPEAPLLLDPGVASALRCEDSLAKIQAAKGWLWKPQDALADLSDASPSGSGVAAGQTNAALVAPLTFSGDVATGTLLFAFGATLAEARVALDAERALAPAARLAAAESAASTVLGEARLPDPALGDRVRRVALRALVNVYVARDAQSGAIVASVSRQPPYHLDWPRDGAFFTAALDVAGLVPWARKRHEWYAGLARAQPTKGSPLLTPKVPVDPTTGEQSFPADAWEMNYFADGTIGGPIRFEIDNTALHLWSLALTAAHLTGDERVAYVQAIWPSAERALELLVRWREPETGLPALANEDDNMDLTSGLHGAVAVHAALVGGARLAFVAGDSAARDRYQAEAKQLRAAILDHYWDADLGRFRTQRDQPAPTGSGSVAWAIWPGRLLDPDDERLEQQLTADIDTIVERLSGSEEGTAYAPKSILAAALYGRDGGARDGARHALDLLAEVATSDTLHFGETYLVTSKDPLTWSNRVAAPHVWAGVLFYMSAMSLTDPEPFVLDERELPLPGESASGVELEPAGGLGCGAARRGRGSSPSTLLCLAAAALLGAVRRRRLGNRAPGAPSGPEPEPNPAPGSPRAGRITCDRDCRLPGSP